MEDEKKTSTPEPIEDKVDKPVETTTPTTPLIDVANAVAERIEQANVKTEALLKEQVDLEARKALGGEGGGHAELNLISEEDKKKKEAAEFFEGTELERAILNDGKK